MNSAQIVISVIAILIVAAIAWRVRAATDAARLRPRDSTWSRRAASVP
jgi:hypothetical protein